jgi:hypothetical protein
MNPKTAAALAVFVLFVCVNPSHAQGNCRLTAFDDEKRDAATVERLETAWSVAYLQGDTNFERCLLTPDFTEILRSGEVKALSDELALAEKNKGKNLPIPDLPKVTVFIHGNVAVAHGVSKSTAPDGTVLETRFADYYVWERGVWRAFFAQQTAISESAHRN